MKSAKGCNLSEMYILNSGKINEKPVDLEEPHPSVNTSTKCGKSKKIKSINSEFTKVVGRCDKSFGR